jgi:hypothetical protein
MGRTGREGRRKDEKQNHDALLPPTPCIGQINECEAMMHQLQKLTEIITILGRGREQKQKGEKDGFKRVDARIEEKRNAKHLGETSALRF